MCSSVRQNYFWTTMSANYFLIKIFCYFFSSCFSHCFRFNPFCYMSLLLQNGLLTDVCVTYIILLLFDHLLLLLIVCHSLNNIVCHLLLDNLLLVFVNL